MYNCPFCDINVNHSWKLCCPACGHIILYCKKCECYSIAQFEEISTGKKNISKCNSCNDSLFYHSVIRKSTIYQCYQYAFKFANRQRVPYYAYFDGSIFPFGQIIGDIGALKNDFWYRNVPYHVLSDDWGLDFSTSRAYDTIVTIDDQNIDCIALSHETGFEIFLISAATFAGLEVAKYSIKRIVETIEKRINAWWKQKKENAFHSYMRCDVPNEEKLVIGIQIRTPSWEITMDKSFNDEEREMLFNLIQSKPVPSRHIEDFIKEIEDFDFQNKIIAATKYLKIVDEEK